jgi:GT2 family glycosyltransferase
MLLPVVYPRRSAAQADSSTGEIAGQTDTQLERGRFDRRIQSNWRHRLANVSVVIVNFNGRHLLPDCLDGLKAQTRAPDEVIIVENGSSDGSRELIAQHYAWVRLIEAGGNLGFATGNNRGIRESTGDIVVLLNNDTVPSPGFIENLVLPMELDDQLSSVAGTLIFSTDVGRVATTGIDVFANGLALDRDVGRMWRELPARSEVFGPSAGAAAYRRSALDDVQLFPEPYFMYLEDADLAWRLRLREHQSITSASAWVLHVYSASAGNRSPFKDYYLARNRAWTLLRCWPSELWRSFWFEVLTYELGAIGYAFVTGRWSSIAGRFDGWSGVRRLIASRRPVQRRRTSSTSDLLYWVRAAPSVRNVFHMRRVIQMVTGSSARKLTD